MKKRYLDRFAEIYKELFGQELSDADALRKATQLLELYKTIYGEIPEDY